ncbi:MAG: GGDEF domain-containing protein [Acidobacteriota bacterium]|jgi:diguanylate cyclase (GGDEF)-like protein
MVMKATRRFLAFFSPGGILLLAVAGLAYSGVLTPYMGAILPAYPVATLAVGILLGLRLGRSRVLSLILTLAAANLVLSNLVGSQPAPGSERLLYDFVAVLVPLNFALFSWLPESGVFNLEGLKRLGILVFEGAAGAVVWFFPGALESLKAGRAPSSLTAMPAPALAAFVLALAALSVGYYLRRGSMEASLLWALPAAFLALNIGAGGPLATIFISTAALIIVAGLIEATYGMAFKDPLTNLPSRRALNEALLKLPDTYTLAMVDIDRFKAFNDRYGHDVGDQVLKMVASRLAGAHGAKAFRYGGEEFTLVFPGKRVEDVLPELDRIRKAVAGRPFMLRAPDRPKKKPERPRAAKPAGTASVTVSIGAAGGHDGQRKPQNVLAESDRALYRAKKTGRNKVAAARPVTR